MAFEKRKTWLNKTCLHNTTVQSYLCGWICVTWERVCKKIKHSNFCLPGKIIKQILKSLLLRTRKKVTLKHAQHKSFMASYIYKVNH